MGNEEIDGDEEPLCHTCGGDGYLEANENYNDWVNYGDELVPCSNCRGTGLLKFCSTF